MKKIRHVVIVICTLVLPLLFYFFLQIFGHNEYDLPVYNNTRGLHPSCLSKLVCVHTQKVQLAGQQKFMPSIGKTPVVVCVDVLGPISLRNKFGDRCRFLTIIDTACDYRLRSACLPNFPSHKNTILLDPTGLVRGYYQTAQKKEIDRLQVELTLLLRQLNKL